METIRFEHTEFAWLLLFIPLIWAVYLFSAYRRKKRLMRFGQLSRLDRLMPMYSALRPRFKLLLSLISIASLTIAAMNPQAGSRFEEASRRGVDIIIALDVSRSMLAEDIQPNRLERARLSLTRLIDRLDQDRVGVVLFAGSAITQVPLTADHRAARMLLRGISTESVPVQGTAIGSAIDRAIQSFDNEANRSRVLIILSDGENHLDDPLAAAKRAHEQGIAIHTVGIGTSAGAPIPVYRNGQLTGFFRDRDGQTVISRYDEATLREIALIGGGQFRDGTGADLGLSALLDDIKKMEQQEYESLVVAEYESRFPLFVRLSFLLLLAELLIGPARSRWLSRIRDPFSPMQNLSEGLKTNGSKMLLLIILLLSAGSQAYGSERRNLRQGNQAFRQQEFTDAERKYRDVLEENSGDSRALFNLGNALYRQGRFEEAAELFEALGNTLQNENLSADAWHNLGNALVGQERFSEGIEAYKQALRLRPGDADTRHNLAWAKRMLEEQPPSEGEGDGDQGDDENDQQDGDQQNQKDDQDASDGEDQKQENQGDDANADKNEPQQKRQDQLSQRDAERILDALNQEEQKVLDQLNKTRSQGRPQNVEREW